MGQVQFQQFPAEWRLPLFWSEVDPSKAGFPTTNLPVLLVGQKLTAGAAPSNVPLAVSSESSAVVAFGQGSMLHLMFRALSANNRGLDVRCLPLDEPSSGVAATQTLTFSGTPTATGLFTLYVAGQRVQIPIAVSASPTAIAALLVAKMSTMLDLPVTAAAVAGVVTFTCKWKGATGNDIDLRANYGGLLAGEAPIPGMVATFGGSKLASGAGQPDFAAGIVALGDQPYEFVAMPFTDTTSLSIWNTEYGFSDSGRWGWMRQLRGHVFSAIRGTYSGLLTFAGTQNSGVLSIMAIEVNTPSPVWEIVAAYTAKAGRSIINDPALPLQTLSLDGVVPAPPENRFLTTESQIFAGHGLATQQVGQDNVMRIRRATTTYQFNAYGVGDDAYTDIQTLATLAKVLRNLQYIVTTVFARYKIADDETRFAPGQRVTTPKLIKATIIAQAKEDEYNGLVENIKEFKNHLIVERDPTNPTRVNVLFPPDLVNPLIIFAVLAQFRLQYNRGEGLEVR